MKRPYDDLPLIQQQARPDYRPPVQRTFSTGYRQQTIRRVGLFSAFKVGCLMWLIPAGLVSVFAGVVIFGASRDLRVWGNYAASAAITLLIGGFFAGLGLLMSVALYNVISGLFGGLSLTLEGEGEASAAEPGIGLDVVAVAVPLMAFGAAILLCVVLAGVAMADAAKVYNSTMATVNAQIAQPRR